MATEPASQSADDADVTIERVGEIFRGMADALFCLGVILADAGVVSREQLAAGFAEAVGQLEAQQASYGRLYVPRVLHRLFALPVVGSSKRLDS